MNTTNPLREAFGRWTFECRADSEMLFNARDEFRKCRDKLHREGWKIESEDYHECRVPAEANQRARTLHKTLFHCFRPEPIKEATP